MYHGKKAFGLGQARSIPISASMLQTTYARKFNVGKKLSLPANSATYAAAVEQKKTVSISCTFQSISTNSTNFFSKQKRIKKGYQNSHYF